MKKHQFSENILNEKNKTKQKLFIFLKVNSKKLIEKCK